MSHRLLGTLALSVSIALAGCGVASRHDTSENDVANGDDLTGVTGVERGVHFQGVVFVPTDAGNDVIATAIAREVKTSLGAGRMIKVSLDDRGAMHNLDPSKWTRQVLRVIDPSAPTAPAKSIQKITFAYDDKAIVTHDLDGRSAVDWVVLADDYTTHFDAVKTACSDDQTTDADSLWYHFEPQLSSCDTQIQAELAAITKERTANGSAPDVVGPRESGRWFLPITAKLDAPDLPGKQYSPEYDRLFGVGTDKSQLIVYAFFGVDSDETNPDDVLAQEAARFVRSMLRAQPNFRPVSTNPFAYLLDVYVDGKKLDGVTYDRMLTWIVDQTGYPAEVGADAGKILDLRKQALAKLAERWIYWDLPLSVKASDGSTKTVTVEVRSFFGYEDGSADARQHAQWRYLEAFWYGDVFLYNGHSHFGHGPLEPFDYEPGNFNDRYQIMLVNSCISYNYYHEDFFSMKPGGTKNLDMVVNGLPSYVWGGGEVLARFLSGLIGGTQPTYAQLLQSMRLDTPWGETGYDPMRVADGELDNVFSQTSTPLTVTTLAPVYP
jgi:hypothetical protein